MKNIGIFVVFIATVFLSTKSIWAKLIYLDSLSPLSVLAYRALLSLPFFILPMIHFNWQSVNKKQVFYYSFVGAVLYLISSMADFIGLLYISFCSIVLYIMRIVQQYGSSISMAVFQFIKKAETITNLTTRIE